MADMVHPTQGECGCKDDSHGQHFLLEVGGFGLKGLNVQPFSDNQKKKENLNVDED